MVKSTFLGSCPAPAAQSSPRLMTVQHEGLLHVVCRVLRDVMPGEQALPDEDISLGWLLVAVGGYPVVNIEKTMEDHDFYPLLMGKSTATNYINYGKSPCYYWVNQP